MTVPVNITDPRVAKAYAHPLRIHILGLIDDRVASPSEIAAELNAPLTHVSYHVRQLAGLGLIKLVRTTPRRGAVEHHYTSKINPKITDDAWGQLPDVVKQNLVTGWVQQTGAHVADAVSNGGFDRDNAHMSRNNMDIDQKGWDALAKELGKTLERVHKIMGESKARIDKDSSVETFPASVAMMLFEGPSKKAGLPEDAGIRRHKRRRAKTSA